MATRHSDNDGSDIFWPGYVDAIANLVLNLLFLLTIMTIAVFMFALELGRASKGGQGKPQAAAIQNNAAVASKDTVDPAKENIALKREIQLLNMKLAQQAPQKVQPGGLRKTVDVTSKVSSPTSSVEKTSVNDFEITVNFKDEAVSFTPAEHDRLLESLRPVAASGKTNVLVEVPTGFTEAKRLGFYRAMAVRNVLLELKVPKDSINVSVLEGKSSANASQVKVRSR
jgi:hypothetical protein